MPSFSPSFFLYPAQCTKYISREQKTFISCYFRDRLVLNAATATCSLLPETDSGSGGYRHVAKHASLPMDYGQNIFFSMHVKGDCPTFKSETDLMVHGCCTTCNYRTGKNILSK